MVFEVVKGVGAIVAMIVGLVALWNWWHPNRPRFGVLIKGEQVGIAPPFMDEIKALKQQVKESELDIYRFDRLNRHLTLTISNIGNRPAKGIALAIGQTGIARIKYQGVTKQVDFSSRLSLNDLAIRESVEVELWDDGNSRFFGNYVIDLCHDDGLQIVKIPRLYSGITDAYLTQTGFIGFMVVFFVFGLVVSFAFKQIVNQTNEIVEKSKETPPVVTASDHPSKIETKSDAKSPREAGAEIEPLRLSIDK